MAEAKRQGIKHRRARQEELSERMVLLRGSCSLILQKEKPAATGSRGCVLCVVTSEITTRPSYFFFFLAGFLAAAFFFAIAITPFQKGKREMMNGCILK